MEKIRCASFFAGVGGIDLGFRQAGAFETVYANESDPRPAETFALNFPGAKMDLRDVREVGADEIPGFGVMLAGFPCQPFSVAGRREGFGDAKGRGGLFFELVRVLEAKRPEAAFFENVKNLVAHDGGRTFGAVLGALGEAGYSCSWRVMNASEHGGVPQNRERVYIAAFRDSEALGRFSWPEPVPLSLGIRDVIRFDAPVDEKYYYAEGRYKGDMCRLLAEAMAGDDPERPAAYQWRRGYVRKNKSGVIPALTANQGGGGHNVCLIRADDGRIRKMTPRECFSAQGFPDSFLLPEGMSDSALYRQAGNSVCVPVVRRAAERIALALA